MDFFWFLKLKEFELYWGAVLQHEAIHLNGFLEELGQAVQRPLVISVDNQACIALSKHSMHHNNTKHYALKIHYLQDLCEKGKIQLRYLSTDNMSADLLTKALGKLNTRRFADDIMNGKIKPKKF